MEVSGSLKNGFKKSQGKHFSSWVTLTLSIPLLFPAAGRYTVMSQELLMQEECQVEIAVVGAPEIGRHDGSNLGRKAIH